MSSRDHARRFHFLREIASGGFGSVYLAKVMHTDGFSRIAAVKLLHQRWSENREVAQRMRDEARLLGWLHHRNIVDVIDLTTIGGRVAVVMEYLEGVDLKTVNAALVTRGERASPRAVIEIVGLVASALDAAYNRPPYQGAKPLRVIHRDIKPSNVMVDESGTVKVLDFGVARADFEQRESHTQELQFGSLEYVPPERLFREPETPASDVYSLGATCFELLAGERLGKAKGRAQRHRDMVSDRLALLDRLALPLEQLEPVRALLRRMLAYDHQERPSAVDLHREARQLARQLDGEGLVEWAERVVPPLLKEARDAPREPNPLTDSVLQEDTAASRGFELTDPGLTDPRLEALADEALAPRGPEEAVVPANKPETPPPEEDEAAATALHDATRMASRPRAHPVARTATERRGAPPPVRLEGAPPRTSDTGLLSAPFPKHLATAPAPPARDPGPSQDADAEGDEDSDARRIEPMRASPTLVFPIGEPPGAAAPEPTPVPAPFPPAGSALAPEPTPKPGPRPPDPAAVSEARPARPSPAIVHRVRLGSESTIPPGTLLTPGPGDPASNPRAPAARPAPEAARPDASRPESPRPELPRSPPTLLPPEPPAPATSPATPVEVAEERPAPPPAPTPSALHSRASDLYDDPPPPRRSWVLYLVAALLLGVLVGGSGLAWAAWRWLYLPYVAATPEPAPTPAEDAAPAAPAALAEGGIRFTSALPDTKRLVVTCNGVEVSGTTFADWTGPAPSTCTVRAVLRDRTRVYAEVEGPSGELRCFVDGAESCQP